MGNKRGKYYFLINLILFEISEIVDEFPFENTD
jgi:hypothetical protein